MNDLDNEELKATRELKAINKIISPEEKTADKMLNELGYIEHFKSDYSETYRKDSTHQLGMSIVFRYLGKRVNVPSSLDMQELQAINKKCKELGWIDE